MMKDLNQSPDEEYGDGMEETNGGPLDGCISTLKSVMSNPAKAKAMLPDIIAELEFHNEQMSGDDTEEEGDGMEGEGKGKGLSLVIALGKGKKKDA